jgi:hypothetical protein
MSGRIMSRRWQDYVKIGPHTLRNTARMSLCSEQRTVTLYYAHHSRYMQFRSRLLVRYILK